MVWDEAGYKCEDMKESPAHLRVLQDPDLLHAAYAPGKKDMPLVSSLALQKKEVTPKRGLWAKLRRRFKK